MGESDLSSWPTPGGVGGPTPEISIVVATYNRAGEIGTALDRLLALRPDSPSHEIVVVDNNSRDETRAVVERYVARHPDKVRYLFEGRQGVSYARNTGVAAARAPLIAFTDDDVWVSPDWLVAIRDAFERHPEAAFVGGKCLPRWPEPAPAWLTPEHWGPLALFDYGDEPFATSLDYQRCFGAGNMGIRREVFERVGGFDAATQHAPGAVAAVEDHQLNLRVWQAGLRGWYVPGMVIYSDVPQARTVKRYHRKWFGDHGRAIVRMLPPDHLVDTRGHVVPVPDAPRAFGVPVALVRTTIWHVRRWITDVLSHRPARAFRHELAFRQAWGSVREHRKRAVEARGA